MYRYGNSSESSVSNRTLQYVLHVNSDTTDFRMEILMHLRSLKKTKKDVSLHDPIGTDKEGNEFIINCCMCLRE